MMSAPLARTSSGRIALTVAAVPTGMNAGVRISPRSMAIVPLRAAPSVAAMVKVNRLIATRLAACRPPATLPLPTPNEEAQVQLNHFPEPDAHSDERRNGGFLK